MFNLINMHPHRCRRLTSAGRSLSPAMSRQMMVQHFTFTSQHMQRFVVGESLACYQIKPFCVVDCSYATGS